ncbi:ABC1-domain-containing protein [Boletus coccyginus]|nr:ABC1-domain-containing protein [Boletus coccyginus]
MPPSPAVGWLCVVHTIADIAFRAAQIRSAQALPKSPSQNSKNRPHSVQADTRSSLDPIHLPCVTGKVVELGIPASEGSVVHGESSAPLQLKVVTGHQDNAFPPQLPDAKECSHIETVPAFPTVDPQNTNPVIIHNLQSSKVPSSRLGRLFHYGGLAASLGYGAASEIIRRSTAASADSQQSSLMMTEANIKRLVSKLSQMRGAALKLGQFMSIQDTHMLPPEVDKIFRRVQDSAHYMPDWQMEEVLTSALGPSWADNFTSFDRVPFAAASIGQVHSAILRASASPTNREERIAVKVQFPNIANSIASDLSYVKLLLTAGHLLPKGLFLDRTVQVMKDELADECDYLREAEFLQRYRSVGLLGQDSRFKIPWAWEGSTDRVLVMEHVDGVSVGELSVQTLPQEERNEIAKRIIELCLRELFRFRLMQTDPNWTNFLWNSTTQQVSLVDFGATREYTKEFMDDWLQLLQAAASEDRGACADWSLKLGYLTGEENEVCAPSKAMTFTTVFHATSQIMLNAHVDTMILLATPFRSSTPQPFAFGPGSHWADITGQIRARIPIMLQHRLTPPPRETYSLNRSV